MIARLAALIAAVALAGCAHGPRWPSASPDQQQAQAVKLADDLDDASAQIYGLPDTPETRQLFWRIRRAVADAERLSDRVHSSVCGGLTEKGPVVNSGPSTLRTVRKAPRA